MQKGRPGMSLELIHAVVGPIKPVARKFRARDTFLPLLRFDLFGERSGGFVDVGAQQERAQVAVCFNLSAEAASFGQAASLWFYRGWHREKGRVIGQRRSKRNSGESSDLLLPNMQLKTSTGALSGLKGQKPNETGCPPSRRR